jgi:plasmid stability protein
MKVITLRNIPPDVARELAARAQERGTSASRTILKILEEFFRSSSNGQPDRLHHDLDELAGSWSAEQAAAFDETLREQRAIEFDAWK